MAPNRESDILSTASIDRWVVIGWFTPDYREMTTKLATLMDDFKTPYHFFEKRKPDGVAWEEFTRMKPSIVLEAMARYPDKVLVLVDVDIDVRGSLAPMPEIAGDVAFYMKSRNPRGNRIRFHCSSRAMVFKPTAGATAFVKVWGEKCAAAGRYVFDETMLMLALVECPETAFSALPARYSARDIDDAPSDAVLLHHSASAGKFKMSTLLRKLKIY